MSFIFNDQLARGFQRLHQKLAQDRSLLGNFKTDPTGVAKKFLGDLGIPIPDPATFHVHVLKPGEALPDEPRLATIDRSIYVVRNNGMVEFKAVPGSPNGKDDFMYNPTGACCCCNCGCLEIPA